MKLRPFELILVVVFGVLFFAALILLRSYQPDENSNVSQIGVVEIWGVLTDASFEPILAELRDTNPGFNTVTYRYVPIEEFDSRFVNALADQKAPDLVLLPHDRLVEHRARLQPVGFDSLPIRDFRTTFIDGAEIFALSDGIYGLPVLVDPLVMFWNRNMLSTFNLLSAPKTWEEVVGTVVPTVTVRDYNRVVTTSGIAMGEYSNIRNSFGVISMLLLQGGSGLVTEGQSEYRVNLDERIGQVGLKNPLASAVTFYTNFSNTSNTLYSWNRSLREDKAMFIGENLALYFGYASEGVDIEAKNPNLSFDIAEVPQGSDATVKRTYANFYALAIPRASDNKSGAFVASSILADEANSTKLAAAYNMAPVRRSLLQLGSDGVYSRIAYSAAPNARGWLNPDLDKTGPILTEMLDSVNANRNDASKSAADAISRISDIY
jgi:ABC-type glycerol-3-phosphate transport system substrate-binding protein